MKAITPPKTRPITINDIYGAGGEVVEAIMYLVRSQKLPSHEADCGDAFVAGKSLIRVIRRALEGTQQSMSQYQEEVSLLFEMAKDIPLKTAFASEGSKKAVAVSEADLNGFADVLKDHVYLAIFQKVRVFYDDMQVHYGILYAAIVCMSTELSPENARDQVLEEMRNQFPRVH